MKTDKHRATKQKGTKWISPQRDGHSDPLGNSEARTWSKSARLVLWESDHTALRETQASQGTGQESHEKAFAAS